MAEVEAVSRHEGEIGPHPEGGAHHRQLGLNVERLYHHGEVLFGVIPARFHLWVASRHNRVNKGHRRVNKGHIELDVSPDSGLNMNILHHDSGVSYKRTTHFIRKSKFISFFLLIILHWSVIVFNCSIIKHIYNARIYERNYS